MSKFNEKRISKALSRYNKENKTTMFYLLLNNPHNLLSEQLEAISIVYDFCLLNSNDFIEKIVNSESSLDIGKVLISARHTIKD